MYICSYIYSTVFYHVNKPSAIISITRNLFIYNNFFNGHSKLFNIEILLYNFMNMNFSGFSILKILSKYTNFDFSLGMLRQLHDPGAE